MIRQKICLLTFDFPGPIGNGGIGTAFRALAEELQGCGHDVTVLYPSAYTENLPVTYWINHWRAKGIRFESLFVEGSAKEHAYQAYHWLKHRPFDVIHFHDWKGAGYWLTVAKRCGLAFRDTTLVCQAHGQTFWHLENSGQFLSQPAELELDWLEQRSVEGADVLFSPSQYFCDYMENRGWVLPERRFVSPNLLPSSFHLGHEPEAAELTLRVPVDEIVFFGRLETRKGLELFCQAMTLLLSEGGTRPCRIAFLGKIGEVAGASALAHIAAASATWGIPWMIRNDLDTEGAKGFLAKPGRLAVIASVIENSPYTVLECLAAGQAFLAADVGGVRELIDVRDQVHAVFERTPVALAAQMAQALAHGARLARPAIPLEENRKRWAKWHAGLTPAIQPGGEPARRTTAAPARGALPDNFPLVSVCMATFNRPDVLDMAIRSIEAQTWPNVQLVLVDDASPGVEAQAYLHTLEPRFAARGWTLLRNTTEMWTGRARNYAVAHATGDYVMLMDDDNAAFPHEIETMMQAALASGADVITCQQQPFMGTGEPPRFVARQPQGWMPIGPNLSQALFENCLGDLNMMVRRSVWNALGGFTEDRTGCEDWEFLLRAGLAGHHLECLPEILFCYRVSATSLARRYSRRALYDSFNRAVRPAQDKVPPALRMALRLASEVHFSAGQQRGDGYWASHVASNPALRDIAATGPLGIQGLMRTAEHMATTGAVETSLLLLRQVLLLAPNSPEVVLELLGREEQPLTPPPDSGWLRAVASAMQASQLPRAGLAIGRLITRGDRATAALLADAIALRFPDSEEGRFLKAMTVGF